MSDSITSTHIFTMHGKDSKDPNKKRKMEVSITPNPSNKPGKVGSLKALKKAIDDWAKEFNMTTNVVIDEPEDE